MSVYPAAMRFEEKADGKIYIGEIVIDASLITDDIKAILRSPINSNWVSDANLTPALAALSGTTYEALLENIQKIDARDMLNVIQEAFLGAAGGTKPLSAGAAARPPVSARNTVFAKDEGRSWNTTAIALFGHILISTKANTKASELFANKYKASDIWDMNNKNLAVGAANDSDIFIKVQMAKRFPKSQAQFTLITAAALAKASSLVTSGSSVSSSSSSSAASGNKSAASPAAGHNKNASSFTTASK